MLSFFALKYSSRALSPLRSAYSGAALHAMDTRDLSPLRPVHSGTFRLFGSSRRSGVETDSADSKEEFEREYDYHKPVLRDACLDYLNIREGGIYVDCTLGGGGHRCVNDL
jgi:hypothetical protein